MKILYVARHNSGGNDDEGAITHALSSLGHSVICIDERRRTPFKRLGGDLVLFHKWRAPDVLQDLSGRLIRAFWYFDLVDWPGDPSLAPRCNARRQWMQDILPHVDCGFCTDGDWVANAGQHSKVLSCNSHKLHWLMQGADERVSGPAPGWAPTIRVVSTATVRSGAGRMSFINRMRLRYGGIYLNVEGGWYGRRMAELVADKIVVAPDCPVTDRYWSNRVYVTLNYQALLLHPYSGLLGEQYEDKKEILFYRSRDELDTLLAYFLQESNDAERHRIASNGYQRTLSQNLYRHRCMKLVDTVNGALNG